MRTRERPLLPSPPPSPNLSPCPTRPGRRRLSSARDDAVGSEVSGLLAARALPPAISSFLPADSAWRVFACLRVSARSYLSARNIPYLNLMSLDNLNCRDILRAKKVVVSQSAMAALKERYGAD